jgi:prepilin peptidase CpaA
MLPTLILIAGLSAAVVTDVRSRRIPNWLTVSLATCGLVLSLVGHAVTPGQAFLGLIAGLALMMPGHVIGATGAGDVKLMAAVGALVGSPLVFWAFLFSAVAGGVLAIIVAAQRGILGVTLLGTRDLVTSPAGARPMIESAGRANRFPYGPAIAAGTIAALVLR